MPRRPPVGKHLEHRVGIPAPDGFGYTGDATTEAMDPLEHDDAVADGHAERWIVGRDGLACRLREACARRRPNQ